MSAVATFGAASATFFAAHQFADHWVQTQRQADQKGQPGWTGRLACAAHVASYTFTAAIALLAASWALGMHLDHWRSLAGLLVSALTHYIADRRTPLRRAAVALGKSEAWLDKGGGLYALDQSYHYLWLFVAALIIA